MHNKTFLTIKGMDSHRILDLEKSQCLFWCGKGHNRTTSRKQLKRNTKRLHRPAFQSKLVPRLLKKRLSCVHGWRWSSIIFEWIKDRIRMMLFAISTSYLRSAAIGIDLYHMKIWRFLSHNLEVLLYKLQMHKEVNHEDKKQRADTAHLCLND